MKRKLLLCSLFITSTVLSFAQESIKGKVFDRESNKPIPGATVVVTGTDNGTITNDEGIFMLTSEEKIESVTISCIGHKTQIIDQITPELTVHLEYNLSELNEVVIKGTYTKPVKRASDAIYTGSALTEDGIELMGVSANNSIYNALDLFPGVQVESHDAYGLSENTVRIRCIRDNFSGVTINGFPNYGVMPIGARDDIYDMENMQQVSVYKGATPADLGTATGSKGGAIELQYRRPADKFGVRLDQSAGMHKYTRTFARIDFGKFKSQTSAFISYSFTKADKWKGKGSSGPRNNFSAGITQPITKNLNLEVFANYNEMDRHDYKPLTYTEATQIEQNFENDFNAELTGTPGEDMSYYDYNGGNFINRDLLSNLSFRLSDHQKVSMRYYISSEDADYEEGTQKGPNFFVFNRTRDINRMGFIPEYSGDFNNFRYAAGYWFESADNNAYVYSSQLTEEGLQAAGYSYYTVNNKRSQVHSPYAKLSYKKDKLSFQAGIKYFSFTDPASERYNSVSPTELSETPDPALHTDEIHFNAFLPTAGIGYTFNKNIEVYVNYGKNYMRPYMYSPIISLYVKNQETFTENGMTLQSVFDKWKMETSDNFDVGIRYKTKIFSISPSFFYAKHHDVLASAYDPVVDLDYYQNVGELNAYGTDIECYLFPLEKLMIYFNPTYSIMEYNNELYRKTDDGNEALGIKGNQAPATPEFSMMSGISFSLKNITLSAKLKHTGTRYGDATNTEKIDGYTLMDTFIKYSTPNIPKVKELSIGIELKNITNTKYTGCIDVMDDSIQGSAAYYSGIPFTAAGTLSLKF